MSDQKRMQFPVKLGTLAIAAAFAYCHGIRLVSLADVPSSQRPWALYMQGNVDAVKTTDGGDWLSQISGR